MYLPKSKYIGNLHTPGGEYVLLSDKSSYTGFYFKTYSSKYFTGRSPSKESKELIPLPDDISTTADSPLRQPLPITQYDRIRNNEKEFSMKTTQPIPLFYLQPSQEDYIRGSVYRYFARENSTGLIKEINQDTYTALTRKESTYFYPNYKVARLLWKITLPFFDTSVNNYLVPGAKTLNLQAIQNTEKILPGLSTYLKDPLEFAR